MPSIARELNRGLAATLPASARAEPASSKEETDLTSSCCLLALGMDTATVILGLAAGHWLRFSSGLFGQSASPLRAYWAQILFGALALMFLLLKNGFYEPHALTRRGKIFRVIFDSCLEWFFLFLGFSLIFKIHPPISRLYVAASFFTVSAGLGLWRLFFLHYLSQEHVAEHFRRKVLLVGWNDEALRLFDSLWKTDDLHCRLAGCIPSPAGQFERPPPAGVPVLGGYHQLPEILERRLADTVVLADLNSKLEDIAGLASLCEREMAQFKVAPAFFRILLSGLHLETIRGAPVLGFGKLPLENPLNRALKRAVDVAGGAAGLLLSAPVIAVFAWLVHRESPGPVFYRQTRMGRKGRCFPIIKIRSMRLDAEKDGPGWTRAGDPRRLRVGAFMRRYNIDELPQFWNVLKGDMSLAGPRPERPELISRFKYQIPHYNARHFIKPGLTGWAQVHGLRGDTDLRQRVLYDLYYMEKWSLWLDCLIILRTLGAVRNAY